MWEPATPPCLAQVPALVLLVRKLLELSLAHRPPSLHGGHPPPHRTAAGSAIISSKAGAGSTLLISVVTLFSRFAVVWLMGAACHVAEQPAGLTCVTQAAARGRESIPTDPPRLTSLATFQGP